MCENINLKIPLKSEADINEAVEHFNDCIQQAAWPSTPVPVPKQIKQIKHGNKPDTQRTSQH